MAETSRRCFVISPIGEEGSDIREHADDVFDFIIEPAMKEIGIRAYRSDHNLSAGMITEQMFDSLLGDDVCIAILTFNNPNVFYELAVAQSAGRPTVILIENGNRLPFDLHDVRAIEYDFKPRALRDGVYARQVIEHIRSIEAAGWQTEVPFRRSLSPLGAAHKGMQLYDDIREFGGEERWLDLLTQTDTRFWTAGISMSRLAGRRFRNALIERASNGCDVRVMLMSRDNPVLSSLINEQVGSFTRVANIITEVDREMTALSRAHKGVLYKPIRSGCLHQQLILTDKFAAVRLHCYSRATSESPILWFARPSSQADVFDAEFDTHWANN